MRPRGYTYCKYITTKIGIGSSTSDEKKIAILDLYIYRYQYRKLQCETLERKTRNAGTENLERGTLEQKTQNAGTVEPKTRNAGTENPERRNRKYGTHFLPDSVISYEENARIAIFL